MELEYRVKLFVDILTGCHWVGSARLLPWRRVELLRCRAESPDLRGAWRDFGEGAARFVGYLENPRSFGDWLRAVLIQGKVPSEFRWYFVPARGQGADVLLEARFGSLRFLCGGMTYGGPDVRGEAFRVARQVVGFLEELTGVVQIDLVLPSTALESLRESLEETNFAVKEVL